MPETVERDRDILIGKLQYTTDTTFRGEADAPADRAEAVEQHSMYVVTDGDTAGLHTTTQKAGERLSGMLADDLRDIEVYGPDERSLDQLEGEAARQLDYDLDPLPDDEYRAVLEEAGLGE